MNKIIAIVLALGVAGCVTAAPHTTYHVDDPYQFLAYAASRGSVPVMVVGDPYPGRRAEVEQAAVTAFQNNFPSFGKAFQTAAPAAGEGTKVVLVFASRPPFAPTACADPTRSAAAGAPGAGMMVSAVYCGVGPYSDYWMSFPAPASPDSPDFRQKLAQLAHHAVPRDINPDRRNSGTGAIPN